MEAREQLAPVATTETAHGSLLDEILAETQMKPGDEGYEIAKSGVGAFLAQMLAPSHRGEKVDKVLVDAMIAEIDRKLGAQLDAILHAPEVQKLESSWRGLKHLVDRTDFRENVRIELLSTTKEELAADFEDSPEITKSGLYRLAYSAEYGTFGGQPYGLMVGAFELDHGPVDIGLLKSCAAVAAMSHAPFLSAASSKFFGVSSWTELPKLKDLQSLFEGPQYARWRGFRDGEDARYVGLTAPRMLLRLPYGNATSPVRAFHYEETTDTHDSYLWGATTFALAARIADSFAKYRWCANIIGPQAGGAVEDLPLHQFDAMGEVQTKIPTEVALTERREFELAEQGFIGLVHRKGSDNAASEDVRHLGRGKGGRDEPPARHTAAVHVRDHAPGALPQGAAARADRDVEGARRSRARAQQVDLAVRRRHGEPRAVRALASAASSGADHGRGRPGPARLVSLRPEGAPALQVHGRVLHALARRAIGQTMINAGG